MAKIPSAILVESVKAISMGNVVVTIVVVIGAAISVASGVPIDIAISVAISSVIGIAISSVISGAIGLVIGGVIGAVINVVILVAIAEFYNRGFNNGIAFLYCLLTYGLGTAIGTGIALSFTPYVILAIAATSLPLASMLLYPPIQHRRLVAKYRQQEKHLIEP